jgi:hypothetical protein
MKRQLFGHDGTLSLFQADRIVDEAKNGAFFYRLVLSPDPALEDRLKDLDMWEFARQTVLKLEDWLKKEIQFVAAEHNDHTPIGHVHVIALIQGRLNVADLEALRLASTQVALFQRQERDLALASQQAREAVPVRPFARTVYPADRAYREGLELDDRGDQHGELGPLAQRAVSEELDENPDGRADLPVLRRGRDEDRR